MTSILQTLGDSPKEGEEPQGHEGITPNASGSCDPGMAKKPLHEETAVKNCILA